MVFYFVSKSLKSNDPCIKKDFYIILTCFRTMLINVRQYIFNLQRLCSTETPKNFLFLSFMAMLNGQETKLQHPMAYVNWHFICIKHFVRHFAPFLFHTICDVEKFFFDIKTLCHILKLKYIQYCVEKMSFNLQMKISGLFNVKRNI